MKAVVARAIRTFRAYLGRGVGRQTPRGGVEAVLKNGIGTIPRKAMGISSP